MLSPLFVAATAILAQATAAGPRAATPSGYHNVAEGLADISTNVCYRLATGELRWTPRDINQEIAQIKASGLAHGVPSGVIDAIGPVGRASINRATMASRSYGAHHVLLAVNGAIPGCRVMLAGDDHPALADLLAVELGKAGWTAVPAFTSAGKSFEQRLFRRSQGEEVYNLRAAFRGDRSAGIRVLMAVSIESDPNGRPRGTIEPRPGSDLRAQQAAPDVRILAQAYDRCMATYAVRLTKTAAADGEIYAQAKRSCSPLRSKLTDAINGQRPAREAEEALRTVIGGEEGRFLEMLAAIRSNRAKRSGS